MATTKDDMEVEETTTTNEQEQKEKETIDHPPTLTKYKTSAQIVNDVFQAILKEIKPGAKVLDICQKSDQMISDKTAPLYKKSKKMQKGVAFPTCLSVNNIVCHYSPLEQDQTVINLGDIVRIDLGVHLDGYIAVGATTVIVKEGEITGKEADALAAADAAMEAALRMMKPGKKNSDVTNVVQKVASAYGLNPCEGVLSHEMKRFVIDGNNVILLKPTIEHTVEEFTFQENEVYSLDIVLSTGSGKLRETEPRTSVYKRVPENRIDLKRKSSKQVLGDITSRFSTLPFSLRMLDKKIGKLGILELYRSGLVDAYPVLCEKQGEVVAQIKTTVFITSSEVQKATVTPLQKYKSSKTIEDKEVLDAMKSSLKIKKKKKKANTEAKKDEMEVS